MSKIRSKKIENVFQWSDTNIENNSLDNENGRRARLHSSGFKGNGNNYSNSERIHAADFNYIFNYLAKDLNNIEASIRELYSFINENKNEIDTNLASFTSFQSGEYTTTKNSFENRINTLEGYKITHESEYTNLNNKVNTFIDTTFANFKNNDYTSTKNSYGTRLGTLESFKDAANVDTWTINKIQTNNIIMDNTHTIKVNSPTNNKDVTNKEYVDNKVETLINANNVTQQQEVDRKISDVSGDVSGRIDDLRGTLVESANSIIDSRLSNVAKISTTNTFHEDQIIDNGKKIQLNSSSLGNRYFIRNDNDIFKIEANTGSKPLIAFNGTSFSDSRLLDTIKGVNPRKKVFADLIVSNLYNTYYDDNEYHSNTLDHKDQVENSIKLGYIKSNTSTPGHSWVLVSNQSGDWAIRSANYSFLNVPGDVNYQNDIAFNSGGLSNSRLKTYIDNKLSGQQKDYKIYTTSKTVDISESGTWSKNIYSFSPSINENQQVISMTLLFKLNSNNVSGDYYFQHTISPLPTNKRKMHFTLHTVERNNTTNLKFFEIEQYNSNGSWHDFYLRYLGQQFINNSTWNTNNNIIQVQVIMNYQKK